MTQKTRKSRHTTDLYPQIGRRTDLCKRSITLISTASAQLSFGHLLYMRLSIRKPAPKAQVSFWQRLDSKKRSKAAQNAAIAVADR